jgi:hypothetical protein
MVGLTPGGGAKRSNAVALAASTPSADATAAVNGSTPAAAEAAAAGGDGTAPSSSEAAAAGQAGSSGVSAVRSAAAAALAAAKEAATGGVGRSYNKVTITETRRFAGKDLQVRSWLTRGLDSGRPPHKAAIPIGSCNASMVEGSARAKFQNAEFISTQLFLWCGSLCTGWRTGSCKLGNILAVVQALLSVLL